MWPIAWSRRWRAEWARSVHANRRARASRTASGPAGQDRPAGRRDQAQRSGRQAKNDKVNRDVDTALAMPNVQKKLDMYGAEDGGGSADKLKRFIETETAKWSKVVKDGKGTMDT
ncbi:tripartite tricarboxylate transporter substrate-binding protein [Paucibacter sp. M5-1]|uniref:tripartite tricarboxylate transporter substrate-binding protein n=1 Tax=Paucibacter sp. M5-1 TaxID=3015998 RepID=UPI0022B888C0|nr:tripartite tricarboxylate transporter substrate-binding protein [Paucibacter sp. M5-1]MCZ7883681.1 tripartite tricarboxylate transporter substrate-binding protein [Paucibacter sp. M5-1]